MLPGDRQLRLPCSPLALDAPAKHARERIRRAGADIERGGIGAGRLGEAVEIVMGDADARERRYRRLRGDHESAAGLAVERFDRCAEMSARIERGGRGQAEEAA